MDKHKIKDYTERLKKGTYSNAQKMLYMWIKQEVITLNEYRTLVKNIEVIPCCKSDSELLKSVKKLDYTAWKDKLGLIKDVDKNLYKLNGKHITIKEVLDMYDVYCDTF